MGCQLFTIKNQVKSKGLMSKILIKMMSFWLKLLLIFHPKWEISKMGQSLGWVQGMAQGVWDLISTLKPRLFCRYSEIQMGKSI